MPKKKLGHPEDKALTKKKLILKIIIQVVILIVCGLSLFLWFYNASLDFEVDIIQTGQKGQTGYFTKNKNLLYVMNPSSFTVWLSFSHSGGLTPQERDEIEDRLESQHHEAKILPDYLLS